MARLVLIRTNWFTEESLRLVTWLRSREVRVLGQDGDARSETEAGKSSAESERSLRLGSLGSSQPSCCFVGPLPPR